LLFDTGDDALGKFLLPGLEESGIIVEVSLHGLLGAHFVSIGQEKQHCLEVQFLRTGSSQLVLHVLIGNVL
jgi:hypothetical protein